MTDRKHWFGPKRLGVGIRPVTWQGWVITAIVVVIVVVVVRLVKNGSL